MFRAELQIPLSGGNGRNRRLLNYFNLSFLTFFFCVLQNFKFCDVPSGITNSAQRGFSRFYFCFLFPF
jgi:hypothetical protein